MNKKLFFEGINTVHLPLEGVGGLFLQPINDSDTFLCGPGVPVTLTKQRKRKRVHGPKPQQDSGLIPINDCRCERDGSRMRGPLNWSYIGLWGPWLKGEVGGWGGQLLIVLIY